MDCRVIEIPWRKVVRELYRPRLRLSSTARFDVACFGSAQSRAEEGPVISNGDQVKMRCDRVLLNGSYVFLLASR